MEIKTDPETGLPLLPEGYFWEVAPRVVKKFRWDNETGHQSAYYVDSETEFRVLLKYHGTRVKNWTALEEKWVDETYLSFFGNRTRRVYREVPVKRSEAVETEIVVMQADLFDEVRVTSREEKHRLEDEGYVYLHGGAMYTHGVAHSEWWELKKVEALTDENVQDAACRAYIDWQKKKAADEEAAAKEKAHQENKARLVGKYPPLKIA